VESDADFRDEHGSDGPVPVERLALGALSPVQRAFLDAAVACGHPQVSDHNRRGSVGVGPMPRNVRDGIRMSTALTHLATARGRPNLTLRCDTLVDRVRLSGGRPSGVVLAGGEMIPSDRVVLAAGAYASPAILMRSGIGPATQLRALGVDVVGDLPGVGANLIDHPLVAVDVPGPAGFSGPRFQVIMSMRSSLAAPDGPPDLHLFPAGPFDTSSSPSGGVVGLVTGLLSVRSRGSVRLRSPDPADPPRIDIAHLRDPEDLDRMIEATLEARRLSRTSPLADVVRGAELAPGSDIGDDDRAGLGHSIRSRVASYHHPVGTCAMGPAPESGAVVDARGRVHGVEGVWVADASVMPSIPAANTNLSTIVVAERIAGWLAQR
jgi:choline dehydrogenase